MDTITEKVQQANETMIKKLRHEVDYDRITNHYDVNFIDKIGMLIDQKKSLSYKQQNYLEELFHNKY